MLKDLVLKNRSYRRFYQNVSIPYSTLKEFIELSRVTPSAANRQPLKYILSRTEERNEIIFNTLSWAGYLHDWPGPSEGEKPSAYIIVLGDTEISRQYYVDPGIAMQTILLGAVEQGFGGCIFAAVDRDTLRSALSVQERYEILYVVALGKPKETVLLEEIKDGDVKYWRNGKGIHHVPKRSVNELILEI